MSKTILSGFLLLLVSINIAIAQKTITTVPLARDLQADAQQAQQHNLVLLLIVSESSCGYCHLLKREIIQPMIISGNYTDKVIIRELLLDKYKKIVDFNGDKIRAADIARRYQEWITPTVLFLSPDGEELTERIHGINNVDFYGFYLDKAIAKALAQLAS